MRDPSPPMPVGSVKPILDHKKMESAGPPTRNTPPPPTAALNPARPLPLLLPSRQKKTQIFEDGNLTKLALQCAKKPGQEAEQTTKIVHGPNGRADLFSQVIK